MYFSFINIKYQKVENQYESLPIINMKFCKQERRKASEKWFVS